MVSHAARTRGPSGHPRSIRGTSVSYRKHQKSITKNQKRKTLVDQSLENARKAEESVTGAKQEQQAILTKARQDAQGVIERAEDESKGIVLAGKSKALKEQEEILHKADQQIKQSQKESMDAVKAQAATLITQGVKKILAEEVDEKMNERIIKRAVSSVQK